MSAETEDKHNLQTYPEGANAMAILIALALAGGFADAAAYLLTGSFTGHITGNTVLGGIALSAGKINVFWLRVTAVATFLLATAGGIFLPRLGLGKNATLAVALAVEAALVGVAPLFNILHRSHTHLFMLLCLCLALGLQNGIFSKSKGISLHTTYVTGDATSLLASLFQKPDSHTVVKPSGKRTTGTVLGVTWLSFAIGAVIAGLAVRYFGANALWLLEVPLVLTAIFAWNSASS